MCGVGRIIHPDPSTFSFHKVKYEIFKDMYAYQKKITESMREADSGAWED
jgi:hypothetical protein